MRIGCRAAIRNVDPHRFRHTFGLNFLHNGRNSAMEMVRRYLAMAQADILFAHQVASPVMNWAL